MHIYPNACPVNSDVQSTCSDTWHLSKFILSRMKLYEFQEPIGVDIVFVFKTSYYLLGLWCIVLWPLWIVTNPCYYLHHRLVLEQAIHTVLHVKTAFNWLLDIIIELSMEHVWKINETEIEAESELLKVEQTNDKATNRSQKKNKTRNTSPWTIKT